MTIQRLSGCRPTPLASYLKALGVLRLVGEQLDTSVGGWWQDDHFHVESRSDSDELVGFFLDRYVPSPVVSPWNKDARGDKPGLRALLTSADPRLSEFRLALERGTALAGPIVALALKKQVEKELIIGACRAELSDDAVRWLDAVVVLTDRGPKFPPLLGTGGNMGRSELSAQHAENVCRVLGIGKGPDRALRERWLRAALFDEGRPPLFHSKIGQFDPGGAGGANSAPDGLAESVVNPWDAVLTIEGALMFASSAARRLGPVTSGTVAMPFTVRASHVGYGSSASEEGAKGELWVPLWHRSSSLGELNHLFSEGRAEWNGRQARSGVDFARAVANLGTDRGIASFVRYLFVERFGQSTFAVPVGIHPTEARASVAVLANLDPLLDRIGSDAPARVRVAKRRVDANMLVAVHTGTPRALQDVLIAFAELHEFVRQARGWRERNRSAIRVVGRLKAADWLPHLDDGSGEFEVAAGLASNRDVSTAAGGGSPTTMRSLVSTVAMRSGRAEVWSDPEVDGLWRRPLAAVIADVFTRRTIDQPRPQRVDLGPGDVVESHGVDVAFHRARRVALDSLVSLASGELDMERIRSLLSALVLLEWSGEGAAVARSVGTGRLVPAAVAAVVPFFQTRPVRSRHTTQRLRLRPEPTWPRLLTTGHRGVVAVVGRAVHRLRILGLPVGPIDPERAARSVHADGLIIACACQVADSDVSHLLDVIAPPTHEGSENR